MSYTPPSGNNVAFAFAGAAYVPPAGGTLELSFAEPALSIASVHHNHAAQALQLIQNHCLSASNGEQAHALGVPPLIQNYLLAVSDMAQAHALGVPPLAQIHLLGIEPLTQGHALGTGGLSQLHWLGIDSAAHGHALHSTGLVQNGLLAVSDMAQAHALGTGGLSQLHWLGIGSAAHGHALLEVVLPSQHLLPIQGLLHGLGLNEALAWPAYSEPDQSLLVLRLEAAHRLAHKAEPGQWVVIKEDALRESIGPVAQPDLSIIAKDPSSGRVSEQLEPLSMIVTIDSTPPVAQALEDPTRSVNQKAGERRQVNVVAQEKRWVVIKDSTAQPVAEREDRARRLDLIIKQNIH
jgi:hypothetical protein